MAVAEFIVAETCAMLYCPDLAVHHSTVVTQESFKG